MYVWSQEGIGPISPNRRILFIILPVAFFQVLIQYRDMHGLEPIPSCDMCGLGIGKKLKRCARCTGLYCSRDCQLKAWEKFHKINCQDFVKTRIDGSDSD